MVCYYYAALRTRRGQARSYVGAPVEIPQLGKRFPTTGIEPLQPLRDNFNERALASRTGGDSDRSAKDQGRWSSQNKVRSEHQYFAPYLGFSPPSETLCFPRLMTLRWVVSFRTSRSQRSDDSMLFAANCQLHVRLRPAASLSPRFPRPNFSVVRARIQ